MWIHAHTRAEAGSPPSTRSWRMASDPDAPRTRIESIYDSKISSTGRNHIPAIRSSRHSCPAVPPFADPLRSDRRTRAGADDGLPRNPRLGLRSTDRRRSRPPLQRVPPRAWLALAPRRGAPRSLRRSHGLADREYPLLLGAHALLRPLLLALPPPRALPTDQPCPLADARGHAEFRLLLRLRPPRRRPRPTRRVRRRLLLHLRPAPRRPDRSRPALAPVLRRLHRLGHGRALLARLHAASSAPRRLSRIGRLRPPGLGLSLQRPLPRLCLSRHRTLRPPPSSLASGHSSNRARGGALCVGLHRSLDRAGLAPRQGLSRRLLDHPRVGPATGQSTPTPAPRPSSMSGSTAGSTAGGRHPPP